MSPTALMFLWVLIALVSLVTTSETYYSVSRTRKYFDVDDFLLVACGAASFILGSFLFSKSVIFVKALPVRLKFDRRVNAFSYFVFILYIFAFFIWLGPTMNLSTLVHLGSGNIDALRESGNQISGLTTLTQVGIPLAVVCAYAVSSKGNLSNAILSRYRWMLAFIVVCTLYRVLIWSERLAIFEIAVPVAVVFILARFRSKVILNALPFVALFLTVIMFGIFEYFRSWYYYKDTGVSLVEFTLGRFTSYYITAFNNMSVLLDMTEVNYIPLHVLGFVFQFPGIAPLNAMIEAYWFGTYWPMLNNYLNPEYNLFSAFGVIFRDLGIVLGCVTLFIFGCVSGRLYSSFRAGFVLGSLFYPIWMIGLFDFGRILWWTGGRALPAFVLAVFFFLLFRRAVGTSNSGNSHESEQRFIGPVVPSDQALS